MAQDFNHSDNAGCQGVHGIVRDTAPIPDSLGLTGSGGFIVRWMVFR